MTFCLGVSSNFPSLEYHNTRPVPHLSITLHTTAEITHSYRKFCPHLHLVVKFDFITLNSCDGQYKEEECEEMPTFQRHPDFKSYI